MNKILPVVLPWVAIAGCVVEIVATLATGRQPGVAAFIAWVMITAPWCVISLLQQATIRHLERRLAGSKP